MSEEVVEHMKPVATLVPRLCILRNSSFSITRADLRYETLDSMILVTRTIVSKLHHVPLQQSTAQHVHSVPAPAISQSSTHFAMPSPFIFAEPSSRYPGTAEDIPPKTAHFLLDKEEEKIEEENDTPGLLPNTSILTFNKEDHTLGNLLSQRLHQYHYIRFSAYKVEHPLVARFPVRVSSDGSIWPGNAVIKCCKDLDEDLKTLNESFQ
jgi:DNA-directed RNA polymerase II subunit RPB11